MMWGIEDTPASVPWQLFNFMDTLFDPEFQWWLGSMLVAFLLAIAVAEIMAQRKHHLAIQALRNGRDIQKGGTR